MPVAKVITSNEFKEIMNDFTSPLEVIREAIQNSYDANADTIIIDIKRNQTSQGESLDVSIEDDGDGIDINKFDKFFNLGDSTKKNDPSLIGEKGHGTKIFYNSNKVILESWINYKKYICTLDSPYQKLFKNKDLDYTDPVEVENIERKEKGTKVTIEGYLKNTSTMPFDKFSHPAVKDYILWYTVFASIEPQFGKVCNKKVYLRSFDSSYPSLQNEFQYSINMSGFEEIKFGHIFPQKEYTSKADLKKLSKEKDIRNWEDLFCKKLYCKELVLPVLSKPIQVIIWAEGDKIKKLYNPLIRERVTSNTKDFQYKVGDRYGFWACKNYIPIQKIDDWITGKGNYTKFHAFLNFDDFALTANRSSIENTKPEFLKVIQEKLDQIFDEVLKDKAYQEWVTLELLADQERSAKEEKKEFSERLKNSKKRRKIKLGNITYFEPSYEGEVALLFDGLLQVFPEILDYEILDYSTHKGIDFLVRKNKSIPIENDSSVGYIELKFNLEKGRFNHSFENLREIICFNKNGLRDGDTITDLNEKKLKVTNNQNGWVLADFNGDVGHSIKIFIIEDFLRSKNLDFV